MGGRGSGYKREAGNGGETIDPPPTLIYMRLMLSTSANTIPILIAPNPVLKAKAKPVGLA